MSRPSFWLALTLTLLLGISLGIQLDRGSRIVTAQVPPPSRSERTAPVTISRPIGDEAVYDELTRQYAQFEPINRTFELVARAVAPSVVHIVAKKAGRREERRGSTHLVEETGSGVIVRPGPGREEFVLTNNHVVEGALATDIAITLFDGRVLRPDHLWTDRKADIAVLRLNRDDLPAARLGDSDEIGVGSWVLALGSPFGLTHSVSQGIISARNRHEADLEDDGVENQEFLQTDAAINPGNSGGPLVNLKGEVVGINTAIASSHGGSEGVGFSIPINLARWIMVQLVRQGKVSRGALGVNLRDLDAESAEACGLDRPCGAFILYVGPDTPAARAGVRTGDVVIRYDGIDITDINHLINLVSRTEIGRQVEMLILRDRKSLAIRVSVADQEAILAAASRDSERTPNSRPGAPLRRPVRPEPAEATP